MKARHSCLRDMWDEWYGTGSFDDGKGGIQKRESTLGKAWRRHLDQQQFSRTRRIIAGIDAYADSNGIAAFDACDELNQIFIDCKNSVGKTVQAFQQRGILEKGKPRGRKKKDVTQ